MRVTFVIPPLNLAGGTRVIAIYAEMLQARGHHVQVICPPPPPLRKRGLLGRFREVTAEARPPSHFDGRDVPIKILEAARPVVDSDVPDGDVIIATWWETAEWVNEISARAGRKLYFIQHHEVQEYLSPVRTRATYRMPMHKIVVARWLADVMRDEYGDDDVDLVPNAVDHRQFFAPERSKQARPTVGLMYSVTRWKRFPLALQALQDVRTRLPELHVVCFGMDYPPEPLPGFVSFSHRPSQESLRAAYASCDVWLTASTSEGFNLPAMEAMACRTPVVSTRTGWPAEAIVDGVNGACVAVDDVAALAEATERLLRLPDPQWRRVSDQAFETVRECSWERSTDLFEAALQRAR